MKFLTYVQDVGGPVVIPALAAPKPSFESAEEAVAGRLEWEERITHAHPLRARPRHRQNDHRDPGLPAVVRDRAGRGDRDDERAAAGDPPRRRGQPAAAGGLRGPPGGADVGVAGRAGARGTSSRAPCAGSDYARARDVVDAWFGHPVGLVMHRLFFEQLGPSGVWLEDEDGEPAGFLLGPGERGRPGAGLRAHARRRSRAGGGAGWARACTEDFARAPTRAGAGACARWRRPTGRVAPLPRAARLLRAPGARATWARGRDRIVFERELPLDAARVHPDALSVAIARDHLTGELRMAGSTPHDDRRAPPPRGRRAGRCGSSPATRASRRRAST